MHVKAYAVTEAGGPLSPYEYELGPIGVEEVDIQVTYCGICHSDVNMIDNDWRASKYPLVPGHEIVGKVIRTGQQVKGLEEGQWVGLGWTAYSCQECDYCVKGDHNFCNQAQGTIMGRHGGFADTVRAQARWVFPLPEGVDPSSAGPLFCGGITVFNPILQNQISPLARVGVIGIGGLGHMALAFLRAWGCEVTAFSTSPEKEDEARKLGAHHFVSTYDEDALKKLRNRFDMVLDTVNVELNWDAYLKTLNARGVLHIVGVAPKVSARIGNLMGKQRAISASPTGSPGAISDMLKFAARHQIQPMTESFSMDQVNDALEKLRTGKPRYRIVLHNNDHT